MAYYRLDLPWETPPLNLNDRHSKIVEARRIAAVRRDVGWVAKAARMGTHDRVQVTLNYRPLRSGRRDADNLVATLKPCCDGLVDAGLVVDDIPQHMVKAMPVIHEPDGIRRNLWLDIRVLTEVSVSFADNPLLMRVAVALSGRVWTEPIPEMSVGQWTEVVEVIAGCVRREDAEKRRVDADTRADRMADAADRGPE